MNWLLNLLAMTSVMTVENSVSLELINKKLTVTWTQVVVKIVKLNTKPVAVNEVAVLAWIFKT